MLYSEIKTVESIKWIDKWFWKLQRHGEPEFTVRRLARLFEVTQKFVKDILDGKTYKDVEAKCHFKCMKAKDHASRCLTYKSELPEDMEVSPSPAEMDVLEVDNKEMLEKTEGGIL